MRDSARFDLAVEESMVPEWLTTWRRARKLARDIRELGNEYRPLVEKAEREKDWDEKQRVLSEWSFESRWPESELGVLESRRLRRLAERWNVDSPTLEQDDQTGEWYVPDALRRKMRREIIAARRESIRWWVQVLVMPLMAVLSTTTALIALILALRG